VLCKAHRARAGERERKDSPGGNRLIIRAVPRVF
jgi:hypothetical protein